MNTPAVRAIPEGMHTLTPHLVCAGAADALSFYARALGATELSRLPGPDGRLMHASIRVGNSVFFVVDEWPDMGSRGPKALGSTPVTLHLYTEDADALFEQAVKAGAKPLMPVAEMFWGDRYGQFEDPFGHRWSVATHVRDLTPEQIQENMRRMMPMDCPEGPNAS